MRRTVVAVVVGAIAGLTAGAGCTHREPAAPAGNAVGEEPALFTVRGRLDAPRELSYAVEAATAPIEADLAQRAIDRAAAVWSATGVVRLLPASDDGAPDIRLGWRRGHHGACQPFGPGAEVAHSGPVRRGTFVHFDLGHAWDERSIFGTAVHELGHVLGLGHSAAPDAAMGTAVDRPTALSRHDLAGLASLYGGAALAPAASDLRIGGDTWLRRTCPTATTAFAVFDTDGDGDDEVIVWRTDKAGAGQVTIFHFAPGPVLDHTLGPFFGVVAPEGDVGFAASPAGVRYLVCRFASGATVLRQFDQHGAPAMPSVPPPPDLSATAAQSGDLDGDGEVDRIERFRSSP
ncbi:MAG: matrixin family metalloprotease [Planctomycetes bacterium]|nr:matrixin family metalloprotease [Planctomycetota bacterium]